MHKELIGMLTLLCLAGTAAGQDRAAAEEDIRPAVNVAGVRQTETADESADADLNAADYAVMDELELSRTEITGNQELPKVMHIVPWRRSDPADLLGRPANSLLDEILAPLDRTEFTRQIRYFDELQSD